MSAALSWVREAFEYQIKYLWGKCKTFLGVSKWEIAWAMIGYSDITTYMFIKSAYEENFSWCGFIFTAGPVRPFFTNETFIFRIKTPYRGSYDIYIEFN